MKKGIALVLIHGFPLDSSMWEEQKEFFKDFCGIHCPDLPGFGLNNETAPTTIEEYAKFIKNYIENRKLNRMVLCGFSMGGYITFAFYEMFPQIVEALIFADTRAKEDSPEGKNQRNIAIENAKNYGTNFFEENMPQKLLSGENITNQKIVLKVKKIISNQKQESIINSLVAMRDRKDRSFILEKIEVPTLFVCGENDALTPPCEMEEMSKTAKDSHFKIIKNSGHLSNIENPEEFNKTVFDFLESL